MKKVICLILSLILVLGMAVTAFAATDYDPTQKPGDFNPAPNNPGNFNPAPNNPAPEKDEDYINPGVTEIVPEDDEEDEEANPNTGAPVVFAPFILAAAGAAVVIGKRK